MKTEAALEYAIIDLKPPRLWALKKKNKVLECLYFMFFVVDPIQQAHKWSEIISKEDFTFSYTCNFTRFAFVNFCTFVAWLLHKNLLISSCSRNNNFELSFENCSDNFLDQGKGITIFKQNTFITCNTDSTLA